MKCSVNPDVLGEMYRGNCADVSGDARRISGAREFRQKSVQMAVAGVVGGDTIVGDAEARDLLVIASRLL